MSSNNQHQQNPLQQNGQNLPSNFGSEGWMTDPFSLAPSANANSDLNGVGNGQKSSYKEQTYTLPGSVTYQEWTG